MPRLNIIPLLLFLLTGFPTWGAAEPPGTYCAFVYNAEAVQGGTQYTDLRLKVYASRVAEDAYALTGMISNLHGDFVVLTGAAARLGILWRISLLGTLQTTDARGYYVLSGMIDLIGGRVTGFIGNVNVSFHGADDFNKPPEHPQAGVVELVECVGFTL